MGFFDAAFALVGGPALVHPSGACQPLFASSYCKKLTNPLSVSPRMRICRKLGEIFVPRELCRPKEKRDKRIPALGGKNAAALCIVCLFAPLFPGRHLGRIRAGGAGGRRSSRSAPCLRLWYHARAPMLAAPPCRA